MSVIIALAGFAGCLLIAMLLGQLKTEKATQVEPALPVTKEAPVENATNGRYQVATATAVSATGKEPAGLIVVCDTVTGQCWACHPDFGEWRDCRSPLTDSIAAATDFSAAGLSYRRDRVPESKVAG